MLSPPTPSGMITGMATSVKAIHQPPLLTRRTGPILALLLRQNRTHSYECSAWWYILLPSQELEENTLIWLLAWCSSQEGQPGVLVLPFWESCGKRIVPVWKYLSGPSFLLSWKLGWVPSEMLSLLSDSNIISKTNIWPVAFLRSFPYITVACKEESLHCQEGKLLGKGLKMKLPIL